MDFDATNAEPLVATAARLLAARGATIEVALLAAATSTIDQVEYDNWNGGQNYYAIRLEIPVSLYSQFEATQRDALENSIMGVIGPLLRGAEGEHVQSVIITPLVSAEPGWQAKAKAWLAGAGLSNQGRVRSDNIASRSCDGLLFRSQPEIYLYQALKGLGVSFAPLPVFVRGGSTYRRIEPDFVLIKNGIIMAVEVDGDTVHQETPREAHDRLTMLAHEGVHIERVDANDCNSAAKAKNCAERLLENRCSVEVIEVNGVAGWNGSFQVFSTYLKTSTTFCALG